MLFFLVEMMISVRTEREQKAQAADWLNRNDIIVRSFRSENLILLFGFLRIRPRSVFIKTLHITTWLFLETGVYHPLLLVLIYNNSV